jgi:hypothetical protein
MLIIPTLFLAATLPSDVPPWALKGILAVESRSFYLPNGSIKWVDRKRGASGERGCFQVTRAAFKDVALKGETFDMLEQDPIFCEVVACRYLAKLHKGNWKNTIQWYNAGAGNKSPTYLRLVIREGSKPLTQGEGCASQIRNH